MRLSRFLLLLAAGAALWFVIFATGRHAWRALTAPPAIQHLTIDHDWNTRYAQGIFREMNKRYGWTDDAAYVEDRLVSPDERRILASLLEWTSCKNASIGKPAPGDWVLRVDLTGYHVGPGPQGVYGWALLAPDGKLTAMRSANEIPELTSDVCQFVQRGPR